MFGIFPFPFNPFGVRQSLMGETPKTALAHLFPLTTRVQKAIDCTLTPRAALTRNNKNQYSHAQCPMPNAQCPIFKAGLLLTVNC